MRGYMCRGFVLLAILFGANGVAAFKLAHHREITKEALGIKGVTFEGTSMKFPSEVLSFIALQQGALDAAPPTGQFTEAFWHVDDESFAAANENILKQRDLIIKRLLEKPLEADDIDAARVFLARAIHGIQDFYSHSNWVELNKTDVNSDLGVSPFTFPIAGSTEKVCSAPGTLSDAGLTKLTSGYYQGSLLEKCDVPAGKCRHGASSCETGLNKDDTDRPGFEEAKRLATLATRKFVQELVNDARLQGKAAIVKRFFTDSPPRQ
jgi:hypothetical protein